MPKASELYPKEYITHEILPEEGYEFTIVRQDVKEMGKEKKETPVLYFEETDKYFTVNQTNWNAIVKVTGQEDSDDWAGHKITLYPTETTFGGETKPCIRVKTIVKRKSSEELKGSGLFKKARPAVDADADADGVAGGDEESF